MKPRPLSIAIASVLIASGAGLVVADPPIEFDPPGPPPWAGGPPPWSPASPDFEQANCPPPDIDLCVWDDAAEELYAEWEDIRDLCTKYGGDVEFEIVVTYDCTDPPATGATTTISVEIDLDTDIAEPFAYECTAGDCVAVIEYADILLHLDAAAEAAADDLCDPGEHVYSFGDWKENPYPLFSAKQMDPGKHRGPQNRVKDYEDCVSSGA
jgi:hypothetical protein